MRSDMAACTSGHTCHQRKEERGGRAGLLVGWAVHQWPRSRTVCPWTAASIPQTHLNHSIPLNMVDCHSGIVTPPHLHPTFYPCFLDPTCSNKAA